MSSSREDQLTAAKNVCLIHPTACEELLQHPVIWPRLLALTVGAIRTWRNKKTDQNRVAAEHFAVALYHLLLLQPLDYEKREQIKRMLPLEMFQLTQPGETWLANLGYILCGYDTLISVPFISLLVSFQFGATASSRIEPQDEKSLLLAAQAYKGENLDSSLAQALPVLPRLIFPFGDDPTGGSNTVPIYRLWLSAIRRNVYNWCQGRNGDIWRKSGFAKRVVSYLGHPAELVVTWEVADIMASLSGVSLVGRRKFLDEGAIDALITVSTQITKKMEIYSQWRLLIWLLLLWGSPDESPDIEWATDSILIALREFIPVRWPTDDVVQDRLQGFIEYLKERRSDAAIIAHQLDVAINRIYGSKYTWNYLIFQDVKPLASCSRSTFVEDGLP
ncbi:hypothetical protein M407DRAFT_9653 [Tulasnella calospora MUT 4182]|uniref:Uncharacterized protein n=1 Tax=Tulasnella calospora MUT 4182 TaxID=1051891 RepID=A0A0C3QDR5_9AGAM|nr:hypothetical protein M407DRAFT_9653 [Tulasnella calospora MUT 4182]